MVDEHTATRAAVDDVLESLQKARQVLRESEITYRRFRRRLESGRSVEDAFSNLGVPEMRRRLGESLAELDRARFEARRAIIAQGTAEGLSLGALARLWGVSRQLVTRTAHGVRSRPRSAVRSSESYSRTPSSSKRLRSVSSSPRISPST